MSKAYEITREQDRITIRLKTELIDQEYLERFLDYLELELIQKNSALSEEQATELAEEVDREVWGKIKHKYTGDK